MEKEGISYHDALLHLAKKYGIKVEEKELTDEERELQSRKEGMFIANEWAMQYFEHNLTQTDDGRDIGLQYLYGRGVTEEAVRQFHLGYAIDRGNDFVDAARKKGFSIDTMKTLGLVGTSQQGYEYDRFRGRVIFPILNSSGKVIAFGGRDLKGGPAKYINSPESELYKKSNELYGMYQARSAIVREDRCFLVEGYLDVIGMWQSGLKNVVASSGTALTDGQIALIHRFTKNVTLIYDGDAAGIKASLRGIDMLLSHQLDIKVLLLPDGDDPDSFARKHSPEEFRNYIKAHEADIIRFKTQVLMNEVNDDPMRRVEAIRSVVQSLACIPDKVKRDVYIQECSRILNVSEESVGAATAKARAVIVEQLKKQRRLRELNKDLDNGRILPQQDSAHTSHGHNDQTEVIAYHTNQTADIDHTSAANVQNQIKLSETSQFSQNILQPFEWKVLEYCIKYGFLDFCDGVDENGGKVTMNVIEFVSEELAADNIEFSVPEYASVFHLLKTMAADFRNERQKFYDTIASEKENMRKKGFQEIALRDLSVGDIQKEEAKLEDSLAEWENDRLNEFAKAYPSRVLASHEDDTIRALTTEAISERHQLSHIYSRERPVEKEEDKLFNLVPTALTVWKNGILDQQLNNLFAKFREISGKGMEEEERKMQAQLNDLIRMRSEVAKNIGDRILDPGKGVVRSPRIKR